MTACYHISPPQGSCAALPLKLALPPGPLPLHSATLLVEDQHVVHGLAGCIGPRHLRRGSFFSVLGNHLSEGCDHFATFLQGFFERVGIDALEGDRIPARDPPSEPVTVRE